MSQKLTKHGIPKIPIPIGRQRKQIAKEMDWENKRLYLFEKFNGHCFYCGKTMSFAKFTLDHLTSKRNGGNDDLNNLVPCCFGCNQDKMWLNLEQYRIRRFGDRDKKFYGEKQK